MPITVEDIEYINTKEAITLLETSGQTFYTNAKPLLQTYKFGAKKTPWYKKSDVEALKRGRFTGPREPIIIKGMFQNWNEYVRSLGIGADTTNAEIIVTTLPQAVAKVFNLDTSRQFLKRQRFTMAEGIYLCVWDTYYPYELIEDDLEEIKRNFDYSIVEGIKARHGIAPGANREIYRARPATFREQEQMQLVTDEPMLNLQRISYTHDGETLILVSDMALRGEWFAYEREEKPTHWPASSPGTKAPRPRLEAPGEGLQPGEMLLSELIHRHQIKNAERRRIIRALENDETIVLHRRDVGGYPPKIALDQQGQAAFMLLVTQS